MANDPLPVAQRAPRIDALERELDGLGQGTTRYTQSTGVQGRFNPEPASAPA